MTVLIGVNGFKRAGKNTAGNVIQRWAENRNLVASQRGFAELLKLSAARSLGIYSAQSINDAVVLMDSLKESGTITIEIPEQSIMKSISGREYLKWYGTEGHRDVFGDTFWVDQILPLHYPWASHFAVLANHNEAILPDIAVVTDVRFVNEASRIRELGGQVLEIVRPGLTSDADGHGSEQPLPREWVDYTIRNDSSLEHFEVDVNSWMTGEHHMRFVESDPIYERFPD